MRRQSLVAVLAIVAVGSTISACGSPSSGTLPTLGRTTELFHDGLGFGQVRPSEIFNGGDPTGRIQMVTWSSWGGSEARGLGMSDYVTGTESVAGGTEESATIVAFNLGSCHGRDMYRSVEWYYPQHGERFDPSTYEDICNGEYVTGGYPDHP